MSQYLFVFSILAFLALINNIKEIRQVRLALFLFSVLLLVLFSGFRAAGVGADDWVYINKFWDIPDISHWVFGGYNYTFEQAYMEPLYILLGAIIRFFTDKYVFLFLSVALIAVSINSYNYYRYTPYVFLALMLYFVHTYLYRDMNQIRAGVAAAIGLFLISQIYTRQHIKVYLTILISSMFHMGALLYLVPYFLSFAEITKKRIVYGLLAACILGFVGITPFLLSVFPDLGYISIKLRDYSHSQYAEPIGFSDITNLKNLFFLVVLLLLWERLEPKVKYFKVLMLFMFLATAWRLTFADFGIIAGRGATYFGIVEVVLIPSLLFAFRQKVFITIIIILYALLTLYLNLFIKEGRGVYDVSMF